MKRVGQLMKEIGFNKDASDGVKEAFIKHLIKAAEGVNLVTPSERREIESNKDRVFPLRTNVAKSAPEQLAFDFDSTGTDDSQSS